MLMPRQTQSARSYLLCHSPTPIGRSQGEAKRFGPAPRERRPRGFPSEPASLISQFVKSQNLNSWPIAAVLALPSRTRTVVKS
jgi:hypothetical protein